MDREETSSFLDERATNTLKRELVPLAPGEQQPSSLAEVPEGFRLETDAELRARCLAAMPRRADPRGEGLLKGLVDDTWRRSPIDYSAGHAQYVWSVEGIPERYLALDWYGPGAAINLWNEEGEVCQSADFDELSRHIQYWQRRYQQDANAVGPRDGKPSDFDVMDSFPLIGVCRRTEREQAASIIIRTCQQRGNRWQAVLPREIGQVIQADMHRLGTDHPWNHPMFKPNVYELVGQGYARWLGSLGDSGIELTPAFFHRVERVQHRHD